MKVYSLLCSLCIEDIYDDFPDNTWIWGIGQVFLNFSLIGFFKFGLAAAVTRHEALAREPQVQENFDPFNGIQWADPESVPVC